MTSPDASKLLELAPDATSEQVEARFLELRSKLEDKIAKAPTPGLKEKYRASLTEITQAFETLALAADSSTLPVLNRQTPPSKGPKPEARGQTGEVRTNPADSTSNFSGLKSQVSTPPPTKRVKSGGKEFVFVAIIAIAVLGVGGWWVMKTKAENEEKARIAAETKAEAERQTVREKQRAEDARLAQIAAERTEKERQERLFTQARARMAELNVAYDAAMRAEQAAERELTELKSQERDSARDATTASSPAARRLAAQVRAQDRLVNWMRDTLPTHPARIAKAKAEELLSARALEEAQPAVEGYATAVDELKADIASARSVLTISGPLSFGSNLDQTTWQVTDAFGAKREGIVPAQLPDVAYGRATVTFSRPGWPDLAQTVDVGPTQHEVSARFLIASLRVESTPTGAAVYRGKEQIGVTPLALPSLPTGEVNVRVSLKGHRSRTISGVLTDGQTLTLQAPLEAARATDPEYLLESAVANSLLVTDPQARAYTLSAVIDAAMAIEAVPKSALRPLLDAHLAACRAILQPVERVRAVAQFIQTAARYDFALSLAWAEEAASAYTEATATDDRTHLMYSASNFWMHREPFTRIVSAMARWFPASDWVNVGYVARMYAQLGNETEAQRLIRAVSNEYTSGHLQESVLHGTTARKANPLRMALLQGNLAAAKRELPSLSGKLFISEANAISQDFIRLGDSEGAGHVAKLAGIYQPSVINSGIPIAAKAGNVALVDQLISLLPETAEAPERSRAYRKVAETYADAGWRQQALAAVDQVRNFTTNEYMNERMELAATLISLGRVAAATRLAASAPVPFNKERRLPYLPPPGSTRAWATWLRLSARYRPTSSQ